MDTLCVFGCTGQAELDTSAVSSKPRWLVTVGPQRVLSVCCTGDGGGVKSHKHFFKQIGRSVNATGKNMLAN